MSLLLALLSSALWGVSDFLGGTLSRRVPALAVVAVSQTAALLALVPLAAVLGAPTSWVPGLLAGVAGAVGLASFYGALAGGTMGVVAPLAATGAVVPVVVGLVDGETPGALQAAGIVVALVGVVLASGPELTGGAPARPLVLAAVAALCFGTVMTLLAEGSDGPAGAVVVTMVALRVSQVLLVVPAAALRGELHRSRWAFALPALLAVGAVDVTANTAFAFATRGDLLSVVAVLGSLYPVVTVLLARQVHHERLRAVQVAGVVGTLAGVVLLSAG